MRGPEAPYDLQHNEEWGQIFYQSSNALGLDEILTWKTLY